MKTFFITLGCCIFCFGILHGQYYLRGEVRDEKGRLLTDARIHLFSKGTYPFTSGSSGSFGIPTRLAIDTISVFIEGYELLHVAVESNKYQVLVMKTLPELARQQKNRLLSRILVSNKEDKPNYNMLGESYSSLVENSFVSAAQFPSTGFSLSVDRASYSNIRRFIGNGMTVPPDAVRIEELLNYFDFRNNMQTIDHDSFTCLTTLTTCPWNAEHRLLFVQTGAPVINLDTLPPSNLVFLIDVSGSMERPNRLPLLQSAFKLLVANLRAKDTISIVTYGGGVAVRLSGTSGAEKEKINNLIDSLYADGDTPGEGAIRAAYATAKRSFIPGGNNRVILATDGDFNVGQTSEKELEDMISFERLSGIYLTCIGVGMGNYKDSKLEVLAKKGNGNFAYLDNIDEAEKVLVKEFTKTLYAVAEDAYLDVKFNEKVVQEYRLIGYDNKKDAITDSSSEMEGGEVGSGHHNIALFEISTMQPDSASLIAGLQLQYRKKGRLCKQYFNAANTLIGFNEAPHSLQFATSVSMFGALLKFSKYAPYTYPDILSIATIASEPDNTLEQEFVNLVIKAEKIYHSVKRKR